MRPSEESTGTVTQSNQSRRVPFELGDEYPERFPDVTALDGDASKNPSRRTRLEPVVSLSGVSAVTHATTREPT
ncbi:hypothetical protein [Halopelagius inordinatus]|uniref:hypothetical protein n=1 Tax=Halopelagius inordinatus TaxID=553467 RepID=UPI0015A6C311|nr:hypothetical protein [Halopelagius inordinatus]